VVIVVSILLLISLVTVLMTCLCCYGASSDDESIDGLLLEQYSEKNLSSLSHLPSTSSVRWIRTILITYKPLDICFLSNLVILHKQSNQKKLIMLASYLTLII